MISTRPHLWQRRAFQLNGLLLILPVWFLYQSLNPTFPPEWPEKNAGPFSVAPTPLNEKPPYPHEGSYMKDFSLRLCEGCRERIRLAWLSVGAQPGTAPTDDHGLVHGHGPILHVHAPYPDAVQPGDALWVSLQTWEGTVHHAAWPLQVP